MSDLLWPRSFSFVSACSVEQRQLWDSFFLNVAVATESGFHVVGKKKCLCFLTCNIYLTQGPTENHIFMKWAPCWISVSKVGFGNNHWHRAEVCFGDHCHVPTNPTAEELFSYDYNDHWTFAQLLESWYGNQPYMVVVWFKCCWPVLSHSLDCGLKRFFYVFAVFKHLHCTAVLNPTAGELSLAASCRRLVEIVLVLDLSLTNERKTKSLHLRLSIKCLPCCCCGCLKEVSQFEVHFSFICLLILTKLVSRYWTSTRLDRFESWARSPQESKQNNKEQLWKYSSWV